MSETHDKIEFAMVITVAFGYFVLASLLTVFYPSSQSAAISDSDLHFLIRYETFVLLVLSILLFFRGWRPHALGLKWMPSDPATGFGLATFAYLSYLLIYLVFVNLLPSGEEAGPFAANLSLSSVIAVSLINPVFEEVFVCGYVISHFKRSAGSFWFAVNTSVAIRLAYHLYQGAFGVISIIPLGLVFTYWFARTGRLWPVIIAHAIFDFVALVAYV